jgi:hypothetical protein
MLKKLMMIAAFAPAFVFAAGSADAMPRGGADQLGAASALTLVRDGCGEGWRFSRRRDRCVRIEHNDADDAAAAVNAIIGIIQSFDGNDDKKRHRDGKRKKRDGDRDGKRAHRGKRGDGDGKRKKRNRD